MVRVTTQTTEAGGEIARVQHDWAQMARLLLDRRMGTVLHVDLTIQQVKTLVLVARGTAGTGAELARHLHVSAPTVSAGVERLVELGLLERAVPGAEQGDRRVRRLRTTDQGRAAVERLLGLSPLSAEILAALAPDDLAALRRGTAALRAALEDAAEQGTQS